MNPEIVALARRYLELTTAEARAQVGTRLAEAVLAQARHEEQEPRQFTFQLEEDQGR